MKGITKKLIALFLLLAALCSLSACALSDLELPSLNLFKGKNVGLTMSGNYYDNRAEFKSAARDAAENANEPMPGVARAYLQSVTYEIKDVDKKNELVSVEVHIPDLTDLLPRIVEDVMEENPNASYEELLQLAEEELEEAMPRQSTTTRTLNLRMEKVNGAYQLVCDDYWEQIVFGNLEKMYLEYYQTMIGGLADELPEISE